MNKRSKGKVLLGASYSVIEPLGLLHLAGLARDEGWERKIHLVKDHNFDSFFEAVKDFNPEIIGFNVYTGTQTQLAQTFKKLKKDFPHIKTVVGGPHPTYFPIESSKFADYVVMSEGFNAFRRILRNEASLGVLPMLNSERFPQPDRKTFYEDYPEHAKSRIKSMITMTGCPFKCTYCYNSSSPKDINLTPDLIEQLAKSMGMSGRLFPHNVRTIEDVLTEAKELVENWPTEVIYFQDDVFGFDEKSGGFLEKLANSWPNEIRIPFHAQMRWEMTIKDSGEKRLDLVKKAGGFGLTLAIEAADYIIRKEVLDRPMPESTMIEGMENVISRGFKIRTEQISGLPYGATSESTLMNLNADLGLVELNVKLKEQTGGPTMAWASTFAPYVGTKLGNYSVENGFYEDKLNGDVSESFFDRSVLRFLKEWIGPNLRDLKNNSDIWLQGEELEKYRDKNAELRNIFNFVTLVPKGHILARDYLTSNKPFSYERLGRDTEDHLKKLSSTNLEAKQMLEKIDHMRSFIPTFLVALNGYGNQLEELAPYFACLPYGELAVKRTLNYANNQGKLTPKVLSDATRHHLYDNILYAIDEPISTLDSRVHEISTSRTSTLKV